MAGVTIRITLDDAELTAALDRLAAAGRDLGSFPFARGTRGIVRA